MIVTLAYGGEVGQNLSKSRAFFTLHGWNDSIVTREFDKRKMEPALGSVTPGPGMRVALVLMPVLLKTGNADGEMFEKMSLMSKWLVVCSQASETTGHQAASPGGFG